MPSVHQLETSWDFSPLSITLCHGEYNSVEQGCLKASSFCRLLVQRSKHQPTSSGVASSFPESPVLSPLLVWKPGRMWGTWSSSGPPQPLAHPLRISIYPPTFLDILEKNGIFSARYLELLLYDYNIVNPPNAFFSCMQITHLELLKNLFYHMKVWLTSFALRKKIPCSNSKFSFGCSWQSRAVSFSLMGEF